MIENHPHEALLIAYADGLSTPEEILQVRELLQHDQSARQFLKQLELTDGWLNDARATELDEVPAEVNRYVYNYKSSVEQPARQNRLALVATLLLGLITGGLIATNYQLKDPGTKLGESGSSLPEWVRLVADYHRLYDRETVSTNQTLDANALSATLSTKLGRGVVVPDLTAFDMKLIRVQSLVYENQPIVQLVYLPKNSRPVAVCILAANDAAEKELISGIHVQMRYAYWQDEGHAVVVVGNFPEQRLNETVREVENTLFSAT